MALPIRPHLTRGQVTVVDYHIAEVEVNERSQKQKCHIQTSGRSLHAQEIQFNDTFRNPHGDPANDKLELARSTEEEKQSQLQRLADFHARHAAQAPAMLARLKQAVIDNQNVFEVVMDAVRVCSLGQITNALFEVGGQYRRNM